MSRTNDEFITLIAKYLHQTLGPEEKKALEELLAQDEEKRAFFETVCTPSPMTVDVDHAFQQVLERRTGKQSVSQLFSKSILRYAAAAMLIGVIGLVVYRYIYQHNSKIYQVANGKKMEVVLDDGTHIWLNGGSKLVISNSFGIKDREVQLQGEGYFEVNRDTEHPFLVQTKDMRIRVLGTTFNVRAYEEEAKTEALLVEGRVEMLVGNAGSGHRYVMAPGDKISIASDQGVLQAKVIDNSRSTIESNGLRQQEVTPRAAPAEIQWKDNILTFNADPMRLVQSKIEKWYGVTITINNEELYKKHFTGTFKEAKVTEVLKLLKETGGINNIEIKDNNIILE